MIFHLESKGMILQRRKTPSKYTLYIQPNIILYSAYKGVSLVLTNKIKTPRHILYMV